MAIDLRLKRLEGALKLEAELLARHERLDEERHARSDEKFEVLATLLSDWAKKMKNSAIVSVRQKRPWTA